MLQNKVKLHMMDVDYKDCKRSSFDQLQSLLYDYMRECKMHGGQFTIVRMEVGKKAEDTTIQKICKFADELEDTILYTDCTDSMNYDTNGFIYEMLYGDRYIRVYSNPLTRRLF